jgi:hypothetical protein
VVFIATPHQGSQLASLAKAVASILRTNAQVGDMSHHDAHVRQLGAAFREQRKELQLKVAAFAEGRDIALQHRGWFGMVTRQLGVRVVDPSSSELALEGVTTVPLAEDHFTICKPANRDAQIHLALVAFIKDPVMPQQRVDVAHFLPPIPAPSTNCAESDPVAMCQSLFHLGDDGPQCASPHMPTRNQLMLFLLGWAVHPERVRFAQIETAITASTQTLADALEEVTYSKWSVKNTDGTYSLTRAGVEAAAQTIRCYKKAGW